jgi:hypothetical protein
MAGLDLNRTRVESFVPALPPSIHALPREPEIWKPATGGLLRPVVSDSWCLAVEGARITGQKLVLLLNAVLWILCPYLGDDVGFRRVLVEFGESVEELSHETDEILMPSAEKWSPQLDSWRAVE